MKHAKEVASHHNNSRHCLDETAHTYETKENFLIKANNNLSKKCQYLPIYAVITIYV